MAQYSIFAAPFLALGSLSFYRDVGRDWRGKSFFYLLLLELACWLPLMLLFASAAREWLAGDGKKLTDQLPPISIQKGVVTTAVPQPHYIRFDGEVVAIIDTTGEVKSLEGTTAKALLKKSELIVDNGNGQALPALMASYPNTVLSVLDSMTQIAGVDVTAMLKSAREGEPTAAMNPGAGSSGLPGQQPAARLPAGGTKQEVR